MTLAEFRTMYKGRIRVLEETKTNYIGRKTEQECRGFLDRLFLHKHDYDADIKRTEQEIEELKNVRMWVYLDYKVDGKVESYLEGDTLKEHRTEPIKYGTKIPMKAEAVYYMIPPKHEGLEPSNIRIEYDFETDSELI